MNGHHCLMHSIFKGDVHHGQFSWRQLTEFHALGRENGELKLQLDAARKQLHPTATLHHSLPVTVHATFPTKASAPNQIPVAPTQPQGPYQPMSTTLKQSRSRSASGRTSIQQPGATGVKSPPARRGLNV